MRFYGGHVDQNDRVREEPASGIEQPKQPVPEPQNRDALDESQAWVMTCAPKYFSMSSLIVVRCCSIALILSACRLPRGDVAERRSAP